MTILANKASSYEVDSLGAHNSSSETEEIISLVKALKEQCDFLTNAEKQELKDICFNFIRRVGSEEGNKTPAEVAILPDIFRLLLDKHFG